MKSGEADPNLLLPNPWNSNHVSPDYERRLEASIKRLGMFKPIIVRETEDGLQILGGEHRNRAASRLGMETVRIFNLGVISDAQAMEIGLADNARYGHDDAAELAAIFDQLASPDDIMSFLPFEQNEFTSITNTVSIDFDKIGFEDEIDDAPAAPVVKVAKTHTTMRFKIPVGDEAIVTATMDRLIKDHGLSDSDSQVNAGDALMLLIRELATRKA